MHRKTRGVATAIAVVLTTVLGLLLLAPSTRTGPSKAGTAVGMPSSPDRADSARFVLTWDSRPGVDSFWVSVLMSKSTGGSVLVLERFAREPADSFTVPVPAEDQRLTFTATLRTYRRGLPSRPILTAWSYPVVPSDERVRQDSLQPARYIVAVADSIAPARSASPRPSQSRETERPARETSPLEPPTVRPGPGPQPGCANEPPGLESLTSNDWTEAPRPGSGRDPGWVILARPNLLQVRPDQGPTPGSRVLEGRFPQGAPGGRGPFRLQFNFSRPVTAVYMCMAMKVSPNFTDNGNAGTKFGFLLTPYTSGTQSVNHYFNLTKRLGINLQSGRATLNRIIPSTWATLQHLGEWHRVEWLVQSNTAGLADGVAGVWVDGRRVLSAADVRYFFPGQDPAFTGVTWNPTYGGGTNPVPHDMFVWIGDWYISGRPGPP